MTSRGCIIERDPKERGPKKRWAIIIEGPRDGAGKRKQHWETMHGSKQDAEKRRTEILRQKDTGAWVAPNKLTVEAYLLSWLDAVKHRVSPRTLQGYDDIVRKRLIPNLGGRLLAKLNAGHISDYYAKMQTEGRKGKAKAGLSKRTVLHHHRVLSQALKRAYRLDLVPRNPCDKLDDTPKPKAKEASVLDGEGMVRLLAAAEGTNLAVPILVTLLTGLRRGELLGLAWADVDLDRGELRIARSLQQLRNEAPSFTTPKTDRSKRTIAIKGRVVEALRAHREAQNAERGRIDFAWEDNDLIFPGPDGRPWPPERFTRGFGALARKPGVPSVRFHDLRHTHLTNLLIAGVPLRTVADRAGHSTPNTTMGIYAHTFKPLDAAAAETAENGLSAALARAS